MKSIGDRAGLPDVADPRTCGEDVAANLGRMIALASQHCPDCADYHITNAAIRLIDRAPWKRARPALIGALAPLLSRAGGTGAPIDIVVAGCADTAVLATCVHAAWAAGEHVLRRTRFTVLDRCRSPLLLCEGYAADCRVKIATELVDLTRTATVFPADILVVHHLLPFVAESEIAGLLRRLAGWLKTGGRLVLWHDVAPPEDEHPNRLVKAARISEIKARVAAGEIAIPEPIDIFFARLDNYVGAISEDPAVLAELESVMELISSAGFAVESTAVLPHSCPSRMRRYLMIVAGTGSVRP